MRLKLLLISVIMSLSTASQAQYNNRHSRNAFWTGMILGGTLTHIHRGYGQSQSTVTYNTYPVVQYQQPAQTIVYISPYQQAIPAQPSPVPVYALVQRFNTMCNCYSAQYEQIGWR